MYNYNTSRDYELLWELAKTQEDIICTYDSISLSEYKNKSVCVLKKILDSNIITMFPLGDFILGNDLDKKCFLETCEKYNLEFILPNAWISVKDRLPQEGKYVLTCTSLGGVTINFIISGNYWIIAEEEDVTHWQYLPEAPKGE